MGHSPCAMQYLPHVAFSFEGHASSSELYSTALGNHGGLWKISGYKTDMSRLYFKVYL